jgi:twitching motility protein PilT
MKTHNEAILIVDDDEAIRRLLNQKLSSIGYECEQASNAEQALEKLKEKPVHLVILDITMPGKLGTELLPEIKAAYPETAVIMATSVVDNRVIIQCMKQGAYDFLIKPYSMDEVTLSIHAALRKRELNFADKDSQRQTEGHEVEPRTAAVGKVQADKLLRLTVDKDASDLHLRALVPPVFRIDGVLVQQDLSPITAEEIGEIFASITKPEQRDTFQKDMELDFVYAAPGIARFRVNALWQKGTISLAFRLVPFEVLSIDKLGLPQICKELVLKPRGLILVTGPTGSGKSTTLAAMLDYLNETQSRNIIAIEAPIEYLHSSKKSIVIQRDLGNDTKSFAAALVHSLRHDPDVIVLGEMRDLETVAAALTAAETGHLVLSTLHTSDAAQTVDRIIDIFPSVQQQQIRLQLSQVLEAVLSQTLLRRIEGGRVAAFEIMIATAAVRNIIREGKTFQLANAMQLGAKDGMQSLDHALAELVRKHIVKEEEAMSKSSNPEQLSKLLRSAAF